MAMIKDLMRVLYNAVDKKFSCLCDIQQFKIAGVMIGHILPGHGQL